MTEQENNNLEQIYEIVDCIRTYTYLLKLVRKDIASYDLNLMRELKNDFMQVSADSIDMLLSFLCVDTEQLKLLLKFGSLTYKLNDGLQ